MLDFKQIQFTKDGFKSRAQNDIMRMTLSVGKLFEPHHQGHNYSLDHKTFSVIILQLKIYFSISITYFVIFLLSQNIIIQVIKYIVSASSDLASYVHTRYPRMVTESSYHNCPKTASGILRLVSCYQLHMEQTALLQRIPTRP